MKESIKSIIQWHEDTFKDATLEAQIKKFKDEKGEWEESHELSEIADMFIVACGIGRFGTINALGAFADVYKRCRSMQVSWADLCDEINDKMAINRNRKWNFENGQYQHKTEDEDK